MGSVGLASVPNRRLGFWEACAGAEAMAIHSFCKGESTRTYQSARRLSLIISHADGK